jgi:HAD superfamily hydrolase (TIGR01509 family)
MKSKTGTVVWAALFDWDGVIVDSSAYHRRSWEMLAVRLGRDLPENHFERGFGKRSADIITHILEWTAEPQAVARLTADKGTIYRELVLSDGVEPMPGAAEWLDVLRDRHVPCAVGTSTSRANVTCLLERWGWEHRFDTLVSGEDVVRGKPEPDVFLLAAERLGIPADRAVVFEDSHFGLEAAHAAGMRRVAVAGTHPAFSFSGTDVVVERLDECRIGEIERWF